MAIRSALVAMLIFAGAQQAPDTRLKATLDKLDAASAHFVSAEARVHRDAYNALIKEVDDRQDGTIYFLRDKAGATQMGIRTEGRNARLIEYKGGTLKDYNPGIKCFDTVTRPGIDTYLTLGFGGSGKDLARAWNVTDLGPETIGATKAEKLELVPRDPGVKANVTKVTLWLDLDRDVTLKQVFVSPTGDTNTAIYSDIDTKKKPDTKKYEIPGKPCGK